MAETTKLSVEKTLKKLRSNDEVKSKAERRDEEMEALDEETKRMRAQRLPWRGISESGIESPRRSGRSVG
jgi:hypothetical protein